MTSKAAFPTIFVSHGPPTLLIEPGPTHRFLQALGETLPRPRAIICISAHWETAEPQVRKIEASPKYKSTLIHLLSFDNAYVF